MRKTGLIAAFVIMAVLSACATAQTADVPQNEEETSSVTAFVEPISKEPQVSENEEHMVVSGAMAEMKTVSETAAKPDKTEIKPVEPQKNTEEAANTGQPSESAETSETKAPQEKPADNSPTPAEPKPAEPTAPAEPVTTTPEPQPEPQPEPATDEPAPAAEEPIPAPQPEPEQHEMTSTEKLAKVKELLASNGQFSVSKLYSAIGYPNYSDYAPSCLDLDGEDGMLYYDGFVVYTLKKENSEVVIDVE